MPRKSEFPPINFDSRSFTDIILNNIRRHASDPTRIAFIHAHDQKEVVTFAQLYDRIQRLAGFLKQRGFDSNNVAGIVTYNCWQFAAAFIAVGLRGGALSGASYLFTPFELQQQFNDCKSTVVFCSTETLKATREAAKSVPSIKTLIVISDSHKSVDLLPNEFLFDKILETTLPLNSTHLECDPKKHLLLVPYSSGTTGIPKGVLISHSNFTAMIEMYIEYYQVHIWPKIDKNLQISEEKFLVMLPIYHLYGLFLVSQAMWLGSTCVLMQKFEGHLFCKCIEQFKIRIQYTVPPIVLFLAKSPIVDNYDLSSIRFILTGAAPLGGEVCMEVQKRLPKLTYLVQGYGMTESSVASHFPVLQNNPHTVGKLANCMEEKIVDVVNKKELPRGQTGEICVRGPNVMLGYLNRPKATAETLDTDGWLYTGDIGYLDENNCLYIVDRLKELIKVKGLQVAPAELEAVLLTHPLVGDCAVIGISDAKTGEAPKAFIVKKSKDLTAESIHQFLKGKVAEYKQLKAIEFVQAIPRSPSGKILRRELRDKPSKL
ncbi:AMP-binding enzyme [Aphelenchoides bicaudatus]|nr:AMP-binding enzyme [Aphelenchoides bicaudatus]